MLKVAILDEHGNIVGADPLRLFCKPGVNEKEMFMRFFEELYLHINNNSIDKKQACLLFSYYAIKFDEYRDFRLDITDYKSENELKVEENGNERNIDYKLYWINFRKFVNEMKEEWKNIEKQQIK